MMSSPTNTAASSSLAQKRALVAARLRQAASLPRQSPLSFAQQRLWFLEQLDPGMPLYNIGAVTRIEGSIDSDKLQQALDTIVARHETLRTRFTCPDETPVQVIDPHRRFELKVIDLERCDGHDPDAEARRLIQSELNRPFDLGSQHPLRATLIRLRPNDHRLIFVLHHIIADEWSLRILFKELVALYEGHMAGRPVELPELPIQYADYARWQRERLQGEFLREQVDYWKSQLSGFPAVTELPADHPRSLVPTFNGKIATRVFGAALTDGLKELAHQQEATLFMVLLAGFNALVHRYTRQEDLIVCSPVAGRNRLETEGLIGFFVNTLALRTSVGGDPTFKELLARVREVTLGAMAHQDLPFDRLVEELQPERTLTHLPFTKLMFSFQTGCPEQIEMPGARIHFLEVEPELSKFEITLTLRETRQGLQAAIEYNRDLFEPGTIARLLGHFEMLLERIVEEPDCRISHLPLLTPAERHQLIIEWNDTARDYPRDRCIHELFEAQAARTPEAVALSWGHQKMSYGELNSRANQLARFLKRFDLQPDMPVGLCVSRSLEMVVGMLAILKAGGAYVPLDANYPKDRLAFMLQDCGTPVILTQQHLLGRLPRGAGAKVVCLDADWELIARQLRENTPSPANAGNLAYVMYTSGSTGRPKGVAVPHRAVNRLVVNNDSIPLDGSDRIAQVSNISFDAATFEIWGALLNGGQLVGITRDVALSPRDFAAELREQGITAMFLTAALFNQLASEAPGAFETLRMLIAGGEALDPKWVRAVLRNRPPRRLVNGYGPTENTTFTCCHHIQQLEEGAFNVPIGRPIANSTVYILDPHLNPVPIGVAGELYTGGDGLARGYWNRPELTAEKFVHNPFDTQGGTHLYKTGDLARYLPNGTIEFLGRIDDQVKIRGFRIELGEIETLLGQHPGVRECVVTVWGANSADKRLVAYVAGSPGASLNASELRSFLMAKLPDYMIPSAFVKIDALPLTPNGKVDRKALPAPDQSRPKLDRHYVAPRDSTELQLASIWEGVLGVRPIGVQDKFFDLGGHSMLAVRVIAQIEKALGKKLRLATLFQSPTIEGLAAVLREEIKENAVAGGSSLVEIQGAGSRPPLFLVHGAGGGMFWGYVNLVRRLGTDQPVYGFKSRGLDGYGEFATIPEMAAHYIADLRKLQRHGPYFLGGYCFGGNVAYEMACQLTEQGEQVELVALLNCAPPNSSYGKIPWTPRWALKFGRNLLYWANYFRNWSSTQRREFFRWKWQLLKKRLALGATAGRGDLATVEPGDMVDLSSYTEDQKKIWETHIRGLMNYRPRSYTGTVHLFRSPGHPLWCSFDEHYGWADLAKSVEIITVPGAHEKILEEPWVARLAQQFSTALDRAQERSASQRVQFQRSQTTALVTTTAALQTWGSSVPNAEPVTETTDLAPAEEARQLGYWKSQLSTAPEFLDLPADRPRPVKADQTAAHCLVALEAVVADAVAKLTTEAQCEPFVVFLAAFSTVLHRYSRSDDIVIGSVASPRSPASSKGLSRFDNKIALRCDLSGDPTFRDLIGRLARVSKEALENSSVPFSKVVDTLRPQPSPSFAPIFQVFLRVDKEVFAPAHASIIPSESETEFPGLDLALTLATGQQGIRGSVTYNPALFDAWRVSALVEHLGALLRRAVSQLDSPVSKLDILPEHEAKTLLQDWTATERDYPRDKTLADLFREQALRTPDAVALVCGQTRMTYSQLHRSASQVAGRLRRLGVQDNALVGICLERSAEMVAAILGTLLAGAAYVPLDPKYPKDRLAFTLEDAKVKVLVSQNKLLELLPKIDAPILALDPPQDLSDAPDFEAPGRPAQPAHLAYVIYTSGSTGKPKGVALEHRNAVSFVCWAKETFTAEELSGVLASTSICFDLSIFELFVPLSWGGKVFLVENALSLAGLPGANEVRLINTVPSAMRELLRLRAIPQTVQVINLAGEPLSTELVDQIYRETGVARVFDLYGPTETTTYSTGVLRKSGQPATIGRPLANEQAYVMDPGLHPVPIGVPGELLIGGDGLARGYLNRPELTAQKFVPHPFKSGARLYRTGDLARWRPDGNLEYLGRLDYQVKIRGFRIELGEIESLLKRCPGIAATVVIAREDQPGDKRLVAYVVAQPGAEIKPDDLKQSLRQRLPGFMIPGDVVVLDAMPMTPNGKIDRKALPAPAWPAHSDRSDVVAPRTPLEERLTAIWREVLRLNQISIHDNFFDLGGHSLLAVRVVSAVRDILKIELPLSSVFAAPTIAALAEVVSKAAATGDRASINPITPVPRSGTLPLSYVQERLWFLDQLEPGGAAYNVPTALRLRGSLDLAVLRKALNQVVSRHEALRSTFQDRNGEPVQVIAPNLVVELPCIELQGEPEQQRESRAGELINEFARRPFDLAAGPLIRTTVFRLDETDHILLVVMHHTVSDGWSLALFFQELAALYDEGTGQQPAAQLPRLAVQYADFAHWQRRWMADATLERELDHWQKLLAGAPSEIALPLDHERPERPTRRAQSQSVPIGVELLAKINEVTRREGCTPFVFFLAALMITLRKWTGQEDLVVGTVVAGRTRRELENLIGCFMNFLPLRAQVHDEEDGARILARVREAVLAGQSHQDCPFEKIVGAVNPHRRQDRNPLYNVALLLQNFPANLFATSSLRSSSVPVSLEAALLDLRFEIEQAEQGLSLICEYKTDLFEPGTIKEVLSSCLKVLETLAISPERKVADFQLASGPNSNKVAAITPELAALVVSATFTAEPLAEPLQFWLERLELPGRVEFAPYNQVFQQLLDPASLVAKNTRGLNIILVRLEDWQGASDSEPTSSQAAQSLARTAGEFLQAVRAAAARSSAPLLISFCPASPAVLAEADRGEHLNQLRKNLEQELAQTAGVYLLTADELAKWYPVDAYYDSAGDELGKVPYTPLFFTALGTALVRKYHALNRPACKVIALDCDNTLWSGVCGEEGPKGVQLDDARQALQEFMRNQLKSGALLCLCSKNNEEDVQAVFSERQEFPLQLKDFAASRLNWQLKSENLKSLAKELGLGLDSFVFIDDNPVECAEVQASCPEVLTLQLPEDPALISRFLDHCWVFDRLRITSEDRQRAELYRQNQLREKLREEAPTLQEFLSGLELQVMMEAITPAEWPRVAQLTQRTNQFNLTTRRRTEKDLGAWLQSSQGLAVRVSDRFGDYGLVGVMLYQLTPEAAVVDNFLLSCRVLGRGVEHRMLARLGEIASENRASWVDLHFVPTAKNKPALDFLEGVAAKFKQPLNGGSVFRLPSQFASEVAFCPAEHIEQRAGGILQMNGAQRKGAAGSAASFELCRTIAMESNEVGKIQQEIRKNGSVRKRGHGEYVPPKTELQRQLCEVWQELLHVQPVGIADDFFALGGHSLLAVRLFAEIQKLVGRRLPLLTLFQAPTIEKLARVLSRIEETGSLLVPIRPVGEKAPLFLVHGAGGDVLWGYANLGAHLPTGHPIYGIRSHEHTEVPGKAHLEEMARSYLDVIRTRQPQGPYYLGGYCFGGNVAYEMARQLRMQDQEVALVVLIDTAPANAGYEKMIWWHPAFAWRFARNLRYWLADFMDLQSADRRRFVVRKVRSLGRKLRTRLGFGPKDERFNVEEVIDPRHFPENELKLWQAHLEALVAHVERPYRGRVALLRTRGQPLFCSLENDFCWGKLVDGQVVVKCIPGSHENIFMEPNVRVLASELGGLLQEISNPDAGRANGRVAPEP